MVVYFLQLEHMSTRGDQTCLVTVLTIKLTFSTVETHQVYAVINMEPLTLSCLWNEHINLMFFERSGPIKHRLLTSCIHLAYAVYNVEPSN